MNQFERGFHSTRLTSSITPVARIQVGVDHRRGPLPGLAGNAYWGPSYCGLIFEAKNICMYVFYVYTCVYMYTCMYMYVYRKLPIAQNNTQVYLYLSFDTSHTSRAFCGIFAPTLSEVLCGCVNGLDIPCANLQKFLLSICRGSWEMLRPGSCRHLHRLLRFSARFYTPRLSS